MKYISYTSANSPSLLHKTGALIVAVAAFGVMLMFSAVVLALLLIVVVVGAAYLWWKTRKVRKMMCDMQTAANDGNAFRPETFRAETSRSEIFRDESFKGEVIEGEAVRVHEPRDGKA
jgi:ABC-type siderophore export system fused ATPase/permease subunit